MQPIYLLFISNSFLFYFFIALLGLCIGSFLNVVIYRLPIILHKNWSKECHDYLKLNVKEVQINRFNLAFPPSHCPGCKQRISLWHNIPLFSYIFLKGRCFFCANKIALRYPLIEFLTALLSVMVAIHFGVTLITLFSLVFVWCLIPLAFIDLDTQLLPDIITLPLLWFGLLINIPGYFCPLSSAVIGAIIAYAFLWLIIKLFYLITGKIGMGEGDFKLFAAFGAWFGWQLLPLILLISSLFGSIVGIIYLRVTNAQKDTPLPFGPYLCAAGFITLLYGKTILDWYLNTLYM